MARGLQPLDLFDPAPAEAPRVESRPAPSKLQLWIAVCLPSLAFECLPAVDPSLPAVVVESERGQMHVVAASRAAAEAGIGCGTKLQTALALAASLQVFDRASYLERHGLESLAAWAETLTSVVSIEEPESLLLEVAGSLKLFGSLDAIKAKLRAELGRRYRDFRFCVAPTATAALWLARAASADVLHWAELGGSLANLPLSVTRWPPDVQALLRDIGLRTIGECARLPRDGFARRVGRRYLHDLDRAFGRSVDLRAEFESPHIWSSMVELGEETVDSTIFLDGVERLLEELCAELAKRQADIATLTLAFEHLRQPATVESFDLREPTHEKRRLLQLIEDRLERSVLPVPAVALRLTSGIFRPAALEEANLFDAKPAAESAQALLERLQGRFGKAAVHGVCAVPEHRPEKAWVKSPDGNGRPSRLLAEEARPLWLLQQPAVIEGGKASLTFVSGPERIESGWWDEQDVARDYYVAKNRAGQRLWVFLDHRAHRWFVHGLFG